MELVLELLPEEDCSSGVLHAFRIACGWAEYLPEVVPRVYDLYSQADDVGV